jgi:uncharacterized membrane-anchored protein YhcB (DUF1043 family)
VLVWIVVIVLLGLVFGVGVERLLARLGVRRVETESSRNELRARIEAWQAEHERKRSER